MKRPLPTVRILLLIALLGQSPSSITQQGVQEAQERLRAANVAYKAGDYGDHVAHLEMALAMDPASLRGNRDSHRIRY